VLWIARHGRSRRFGHIKRKSDEDWVKNRQSWRSMIKRTEAGVETWLKCAKGIRKTGLKVADVGNMEKRRKDTFGKASEPYKRGRNG